MSSDNDEQNMGQKNSNSACHKAQSHADTAPAVPRIAPTIRIKVTKRLIAPAMNFGSYPANTPASFCGYTAQDRANIFPDVLNLPRHQICKSRPTPAA